MHVERNNRSLARSTDGKRPKGPITLNSYYPVTNNRAPPLRFIQAISVRKIRYTWSIFAFMERKKIINSQARREFNFAYAGIYCAHVFAYTQFEVGFSAFYYTQYTFSIFFPPKRQQFGRTSEIFSLKTMTNENLWGWSFASGPPWVESDPAFPRIFRQIIKGIPRLR